MEKSKNEKVCSYCGTVPKTKLSFQIHLYWKHTNRDMVKKEAKYKILNKEYFEPKEEENISDEDIDEPDAVDKEDTSSQETRFEISDDEAETHGSNTDTKVGIMLEPSILINSSSKDISDDEEDSFGPDSIDEAKLEPKVELIEEFTDQISDDETEDEDSSKTKENEFAGLPRSVQYLCPISSCSFSVLDNDKNKRLSHIELRHKNIDSNCLNFIKL